MLLGKLLNLSNLLHLICILHIECNKVPRSRHWYEMRSVGSMSRFVLVTTSLSIASDHNLIRVQFGFVPARTSVVRSQKLLLWHVSLLESRPLFALLFCIQLRVFPHKTDDAPLVEQEHAKLPKQLQQQDLSSKRSE